MIRRKSRAGLEGEVYWHLEGLKIENLKHPSNEVLVSAVTKNTIFFPGDSPSQEKPSTL